MLASLIRTQSIHVRVCSGDHTKVNFDNGY